MKFENKILCGDSTKLIKKISDNHVNLIYLDPPFFAEHIFEAKGRYGKINSMEITTCMKLKQHHSLVIVKLYTN